MKRMTFVLAVVMMAGVSLAGYGQQSTATELSHAATVTQQAKPDQHFRLTFVVQEVDEKGKVLNSREYVVGTAFMASIRAGVKVPVPTSPGSSQFTYMDVGVNFDVRQFHVLSATRVEMTISAELSSFDSSSDQTKTQPGIRQNKWSGDEQMVLGERKVIFSSDDLTSKNKVQVELTVSRMD